MNLSPYSRRLIALQLLGGPLVLGSYVAGFFLWPDVTAQMWGGVPPGLRGFYTAWMFVAATGYFFFSYELTFRVDPDALEVLDARGPGVVVAALSLVLFPSAMWLPATAWHLAAPSGPRFAFVWFVLVLVAGGSLTLIAALLTRRPRPGTRSHRLALVGTVVFSVQTVLLDAVVWPILWLRAGMP